MQLKHGISIIAFILIATVCGVLIAIWVFKHFSIYIPLENQAVSIDLKAPLQAKVQIHDALDVDVTGKVNAEIPINEKLNVPITQTLTPRVYFDNQVPIETTIPVKEILKINQNMPIDTKVKVQVLGKDITLPLKGTIPIQMDVPIDLQVPLKQQVHLKFDAPVKTVLKESLHVPLVTTLKANIPIQGHLNVPIKSALEATVDVQNTLPVKIEKGQLTIPLNSLRLSRSIEEPNNSKEHDLKENMTKANTSQSNVVK
nr:MFS transporter [Acinetobacter wuhouensis]